MTDKQQADKLGDLGGYVPWREMKGGKEQCPAGGAERRSRDGGSEGSCEQRHMLRSLRNIPDTAMRPVAGASVASLRNSKITLRFLCKDSKQISP